LRGNTHYINVMVLTSTKKIGALESGEKRMFQYLLTSMFNVIPESDAICQLPTTKVMGS